MFQVAHNYGILAFGFKTYQKIKNDVCCESKVFLWVMGKEQWFCNRFSGCHTIHSNRKVSSRLDALCDWMQFSELLRENRERYKIVSIKHIYNM